jgi:hypothetical protein
MYKGLGDKTMICITKKGGYNPPFVPEARFELACPFERHPLKMVRLPISPSGLTYP